MKYTRWILLLTLLLITFGAWLNGQAKATANTPITIDSTVQPKSEAPTEPANDEFSTLTVNGSQEALTPPSLVNTNPLQLGPALTNETEPNGNIATANTIAGTSAVILGNVYPNADEDFYAFTAQAGDRVYVATMTSFSSNGSTDSVLEIQDSGGVVVEADDNDGSLGGSSSTIAGRALPSAGTYYLRVRHTSATSQLRPYTLYFRLQSGLETPTPEVEANDTPAAANPLPANGWVSGARNPAAASEQDWYSFTANAGDTVFLNLDLDPERDNVQWNGRLGIGLFGDAGNQILVVDDGSTGSATNPLSEAMFMTVKASGTYFAFVDSATATTGGPTATYTLSVTVFPASDQGVNCTTYTSTNVPQVIGPGTGLVSSTITVPGNPRIADIDVAITLDHALMADIDAHLRSPQGNDNGLFTDIGAAATGGQTQMDIVFDDEAGATPLFTVLKGLVVKPELSYRLAWFDGEDAGGTWTLDLRDDGANTSGGNLTAWSIRICEQPPLPACPNGYIPTVLFSTDFETGDAGFTHSGTLDEWERGLPSFAPITTCNSGTNCWKTDLDNTYDASSTQDLKSPSIALTGAGIVGPVTLSWAQRYQIESASFDHGFVDVQLAGGGSPRRLWEHLDATMTDTVGNPGVTLAESSGWSVYHKDISSYLGQNIEFLAHLDSDSTVQLTGLAIDDVSVTACGPIPAAAIVITKTVGLDNTSCASTNNVTLPFFGGPVTYCYEVENIGNVAFSSHTLVDDHLGTLLNNFPYPLAPGASTFVTETAVITQTTTNSATWTATNGTDTASATDTALVTVPVPAPSVNLLKTVGTDPNVCASTDSVSLPFGGGNVTYCYTIQNTGNITLTGHTLADSELGVILNNFPYALGIGNSAFLTVTTNITQTTVNTATWTAVLTGAPVTVSASDSNTAVVNVAPAVPDMAFSPNAFASTQDPDTQVTQTLTISSTGTGNLNWSIAEEPGVVPNSMVLYNNGPIVNSPATGAGGADESALQNSTLGMGTLGFGHQLSANNRVADDFVVTGDGWFVDDITFFAYQTGSSTTSTMLGVNVRIWDGPPNDPQSTVVFGDTSTNRLASTIWSGVYRVTETTHGNASRPIMANVAHVGTFLPPGTYWVDWQTDGSLSSGPWAMPITINGQAVTGNGMQSLAGTWGPANDGGTGTPQQGFPFVITGAPNCAGDIPWVSVNPTTGTTAPGATTDVSVTFDSTGLGVGTYTGTLCLYSDAPTLPYATMPLTLTVNTVPGVVLNPDAEDSGLAGTTVTYTLSLTNTGNVTDTFAITTTGEVWATSVSISSATLGAGESTDLWVTVDIPGGIADGDSDTVTVWATSGLDSNVTDTAVLTTTGYLTATYGVTIGPDLAASGSAGTTITYTLGITNDGNVSDSFDLSFSGNNWATALSASSITLNAGETGTVVVTVDIPLTANNGDTDTATVMAMSPNNSVMDMADVTTTAVVNVTYGVQTSPDMAQNGLVGTTVTYTVDLTNTGDLPNTYALDVTGTWTTTASATSILLNPGEVGTVWVWVEVPAGATSGSSDVATLTASGAGGATDSTDLTTTAVTNPVYGVQVSADMAMSGYPSTTVTYTLHVTNTGDLLGTFSVNVTGTWQTTASANSLVLASGASGTVWVWVQIPANAVAGDNDVATVTVSGDGGAMDMAQLTTTAVVQPAHFVYLPFATTP